MGIQVLNEVTGEAVITDTGPGHDGIDPRRYHVVFDLDAVMTIEKMTGRSAIDILVGLPNLTDCLAMIMAGTAGYQRRNPGVGRRVNPALAKRILVDAGGVLALAPGLAESLSCAEGLGLVDDDNNAAGIDEGDGDDASPLALPGS